MELKLGGKITALRKAKGMTQERLAALVGVSPPAVSKWETNSSYPDITLLCPLARALGTDVDTLLSFEETLHEEQVVKRINEVMKTAWAEGAHAAEPLLQDMLHQYPSSIPLNYYAATVLTAFEMLSVSAPEEEKQAWRRQKKALLQAVYHSGAAAYWQSAVTDLAAMAVAENEPETAEKLLKELPERGSDPTMTWMQLYLSRGERDKAAEVVQKRLYILVQEAQICLGFLTDQRIEPDPERALEIGEVCRQMEILFGCGYGMGDGLLMDLYRRAGQPQKAMECLCRYVDTLTGPLQMPKELLFSAVAKTKGPVNASTKELRQRLLRELQKDECFRAFRDEPRFRAAVRKLEASLR